MELKIEDISSSNKFCTREEVSDELVNHYSELLESGVKLPPITVHRDTQTGKYLILDGFHTFHAALRTGAKMIGVEVTEKTSELDCLVEALQKNSKHGKPLSSKDRRRNIIKILSFDESWDWSNQVIANIAGTSDRTVANIKSELPSPKISGMSEVKCIRNGKPHIVKVNTQPNPSDGNTDKASDLKSEGKSSPSASYLSTTQETEPVDNRYTTTSNEVDDQKDILPDDQKVHLINLMKMLQQKCLSYTRAYDAVNDGSKIISSSFLEKLNTQLSDLKAQAESTASLISEIKEKVCASN